MTQQWHIQYYHLPGQDSPVYVFVESLSENAQAKVSHTIDLLIEYGVQLRGPHVKKLVGLPLWKLRILGEDSIRIFYIAVENSTFLMLHGFQKTSQKTSKNAVGHAQLNTN